MRIQDLTRLLALAAIWGGSFVCMRVAAPAFGPVVTADLRVLLAGLTLLPLALATPPTRALTVTFLMPVFGMIWGVVFLGEVVTTSMLTGCALVIAGTFVVLRAPAASVRKVPAATTPSHGSTGP